MLRTLVRLVLVLALTISVSACEGGGSPSSPSPGPGPGTPPITPPVTYVGPPPGVSAENWLWAFYPDGRLRRPKTGETIHLDISAIGDRDARAKLSAVATAATITMTKDGKVVQKFDVTPVEGGVNFVVTVETGFTCNDVVKTVGGCTIPTYNSKGEVTGGTVKFTHLGILLQAFGDVAHEIYRTMGIVLDGSEGSAMAQRPASKPSPTDIIIFLARYDYPPLVMYSPQ